MLAPNVIDDENGNLLLDADRISRKGAFMGIKEPTQVLRFIFRKRRGVFVNRRNKGASVWEIPHELFLLGTN